MTVNDGGPAYPVECVWVNGKPQGQQTGNSSFWHTGMSLRDRFAMAALQGMMLQGESANSVSDVWDFSIAADLAYEFADAMIKAREQPDTVREG